MMREKDRQRSTDLAALYLLSRQSSARKEGREEEERQREREENGERGRHGERRGELAEPV